jgi:hypothetical protein
MKPKCKGVEPEIQNVSAMMLFMPKNSSCHFNFFC